MLLVASGGLRRAEEARRLHLLRAASYRGGAGWAPQFGPKAWSRGWSTLGMAWLPDGSVLITGSVPAACARARWGARSKADFPGWPEVLARGKGGLPGMWQVVVRISSANRYSFI